MNVANSTEIQGLKEKNESLQKEVTHLNEQLNWLKRQIFGKRSERIIDDQGKYEILHFPYYDELESEESTSSPTTVVPEHKRRKTKSSGKDKISFPDDLPVESTVIDLPEKEKIENELGKPLERIGEEVTQKLAHKPGSYYIKEIIRPKYAVELNGESTIMTADLPDSIISKCRVDESFLADVLTKKFADHLPFYRINEIQSRDEIYVSRQLMSQWVIRIGEELKPLHDRILSKILESNNVFIDETPVKMQAKGLGKTHQAYMWVLAGGQGSDPPYRHFNFRLNRKHEHAQNLLKSYKGVLHSDKYGAYETLASQKKVIWCPCWVHIRRQFIDAETGDLKFRSWVLRKINQLFRFEKVAWARTEEERLWIRKEKEILIIDELIGEIKAKLQECDFPKRSKYRKALGYFVSLIPYLKNYTFHANARMDNNVAERSIRPLAIGRKNWLFVGSEKGGEAAAVIYSLVQTCRCLQINPREYLEDVFRRLMSHNFQDLDQLLPDIWHKNRVNSGLE